MENNELSPRVGNELEDVDHTPMPIKNRISRLFSITSVTGAGYGLSGIESRSSDGSIDAGVIRRASLVFATVDDNLSLHNSDSQGSTEF